MCFSHGRASPDSHGGQESEGTGLEHLEHFTLAVPPTPALRHYLFSLTRVRTRRGGHAAVFTRLPVEEETLINNSNPLTLTLTHV